IVFIDNILMYVKDNNELFHHVKVVLDTIRKVGFGLQETKYIFRRRKVPFFRFEIDCYNDSIQMTYKKLKVITDWPNPETPHHIRSFVGLMGVYSCFVQDFRRISTAL
ncbi:hypothetical protein K440DRAFT_497499, partial [Wilcoxina mikolae CBS 423.85]